VIILPQPFAQYERNNEAQTRSAIEGELNRKQDIGGDHAPDRLILTSPDGARWSITVDNSGVISAVAL